MIVRCAGFIIVLAMVGSAKRLKIEKELQNQQVQSFEELILECRIRGVTDGFIWLHNDKSICTECYIYKTTEIKDFPVSRIEIGKTFFTILR